MSTSQPNGGVTKTLIDLGVHEAFAREGYLKTDGSRDMEKVRERIYDILAKVKVLKKVERRDKATSRGALMSGVFPKTTGPAGWEEEPNPLLAAAIYKELDQRYVWGEAKPDARSQIQRRVAINMGNGYVLCRTKITTNGGDPVDAAYITDDRACIQQDFTRPDNQKGQRVIDSMTRNREMLVQRQPENARTYMRDYKASLEAALKSGMSQLQLAFESVSGNGAEEEEEGEE